MKSKRWLLVSISLLIIFTLGCNLFTKLFQSERTAVSTMAPTLPAPPRPTSVKKRTPEEQAVYFADLLASPDTRLGGWLGIYDALGIPVIGQDGGTLGGTGDDPIGPRYWQLWYASGLDKKGRGIPLRDAGRLIAAGTPELDGRSLGAVLLNDLRLAVKSSDPQVRLMGMFVRERIKRWPSRLDIQDASVTPEKAIIDLPTLQMIEWIVTRGALFQAAARGGKTTGAIRNPAVFSMAIFQKSAGQPSSQKPCSEMMGDGDTTYWTNWLVNKVGGGVQLPGMSNSLPGLLTQMEKILGPASKLIDKATSAVNKLSMISSMLSFMLQMAAIEINPRQVPAPMIRTHHTYRGNDGTIELQLYSAPGKIPNGNELSACLGSFAAGALGISFSFPAEGPISGAEMTVEGGQGFIDLVLFNTDGTDSMRRWTGKDGVAEYKLFGAPQKREVPQTAKPVEKEFSVYVKAQPEETGLNSMLNIFFDGLTFGTAPTSNGAIGSAIDIAKGFQYDMGEYAFKLTDWKTNGYRATGGTGDAVYSGVICSLENPFTVTADAKIIRYPLKFVPSSATGGTVSFVTGVAMLKVDGSGTYTIEGADTDKPRIAMTANSTGTTPKFSRSGGGTVYIDLVPLDTDDCK